MSPLELRPDPFVQAAMTKQSKINMGLGDVGVEKPWRSSGGRGLEGFRTREALAKRGTARGQGPGIKAGGSAVTGCGLRTPAHLILNAARRGLPH